MPFVQNDHSVMWEVSHHPIIVLVLALGVGFLTVWLVLEGLSPFEPTAITDITSVPNLLLDTNTLLRRDVTPLVAALFF